MMKNLIGWSTLFVLFMGFVFVSCEDNDVIDEIIDEQILTQDEIDGLTYMREEEKLARDVYLYLNDKYDVNIFLNISASEQYHMDQLLVLIEKYALEDPSLETRGMFSNDKLQGLYDSLTALGDKSLIDAFKVGLTIEDLDIFDLDEFGLKLVQEDILSVFENLTCGSRNHMRAFNKQLIKNNEQYEAQFISQERYDDIISENNEKCGR